MDVVIGELKKMVWAIGGAFTAVAAGLLAVDMREEGEKDPEVRWIREQDDLVFNFTPNNFRGARKLLDEFAVSHPDFNIVPTVDDDLEELAHREKLEAVDRRGKKYLTRRAIDTIFKRISLKVLRGIVVSENLIDASSSAVYFSMMIPTRELWWNEHVNWDHVYDVLWDGMHPYCPWQIEHGTFNLSMHHAVCGGACFYVWWRIDGRDLSYHEFHSRKLPLMRLSLRDRI